MKTLTLECYRYLPSCTNPQNLVTPGEQVYLILNRAAFTDPAFSGVVPALVTAVVDKCNGCYDYYLEFDEASLPNGISMFCQEDIRTIICDQASVACCEAPILHIHAGTECNDASGGQSTLAYGAILNVVSESLEVTIVNGCLKIEAKQSPYPYVSNPNT